MQWINFGIMQVGTFVRVLKTAELGKRNNLMNGLFKNKVVDINCSKKQILYVCLKENNV